MNNEMNQDYENGNFNEVDTKGDNSDGNFNEVDPTGDNYEGNFNETDPTEEDSDGNLNEDEPTGDEPDENPAETDSYEPPIPDKSSEIKPATPGNSKALLGVVIALGAVIIGLIVFLVVSIVKNKNENNNSQDISQNPTATSSENIETLEISPEISGTTDNGETKDNVEENEEIPTEEPRTFNVTTEIGEYRGLKADYSVTPVTDEDVQKSMDYFVSSCEYDEDITDRPVKEGDNLTIDYVGTMEGVEFQGGTASDVKITLGSAGYIEGFESGLVGKNVGDTVTLDLTFPDPYYTDETKSGKPVTFKVTIKSATEHIVPELTDELVAANSEYKTVEECKKAARELLIEQNTQAAESKMMQDLIKQVIGSAKFSGEIEEQIAYEEEQQIKNLNDQFAGFGYDAATYYSYVMGITEDDFYALIHEQSETSVKYSHCLKEIAKKEGLTISQEEFDTLFEDIFFNTYGLTSKEEVYEYVTEEQAHQFIEEYGLQEKAEKIIKDTAIITTK